jgi:hypothetical protein
MALLTSWATVTGVSTTAGINGQNSYYLTTTSGTSVVSQATTPSLLTPMLQAQDGTFYGIDNGSGNMAKFDQSGNEQWSVPGDSPQIATADDGVIGASGTTYDSSGNATGQIGSLPTKAWFGDSYEDVSNSIQSVDAVPVNPATSFWAFLGGQPSRGGASAKNVFSLGGPTSSPLQTIQGSNLTQCNSGPTIAFPFYGYQRCESYTVLDRNGKQIKRTGIDFDESFPPPPPNRIRMTGSGSTDQNGLLWDNWAQGCGVSACYPGQTYSEKQTITLYKTGATVRVECINFGPTDVTGTDITSNPVASCS